MELKGKYGEAKIFAELFDEQTVNQVYDILNCPISENSHIRIMPDCHAGAGCVIGTTMKISDKVCPNVVGVDIGCGVIVYNLGKKEIDFKVLDEFIKNNIPSGFSINDKNDDLAKSYIDELYCKSYLKNIDRLEKSLGTLGGGNHFIEIDKDEEGNHYLLIHSGSRNFGLQVATYYQKIATQTINELRKNGINEIIERNRKNGTPELIENEIKEFNLSYKREWSESLDYVTDDNLKKYLYDMDVAQRFASQNRIKMATKILSYLEIDPSSNIVCDTVHNYIDIESKIIRKGAVSAKDGELLVIPINMRDGAILCVGKGNPEWNESAPHGAGRIMSRHQAKTELSLGDFEKEMNGIYTTTATQETIDEAPMAYKPIESIINIIQDTVTIQKRIYPIYNFKADGE